MQVIARLVRAEIAGGMPRISHSLLKIDDTVERPRRADPLVHGQAHGLALGMIVLRVLVRGDRAAEYFQPACMCPVDELFVGALDVLGGEWPRIPVGIEGPPDVVDALHD